MRTYNYILLHQETFVRTYDHILTRVKLRWRVLLCALDRGTRFGVAIFS
jgi:hypothetical protein